MLRIFPFSFPYIPKIHQDGGRFGKLNDRQRYCGFDKLSHRIIVHCVL